MHFVNSAEESELRANYHTSRIQYATMFVCIEVTLSAGIAKSIRAQVKRRRRHVGDHDSTARLPSRPWCGGHADATRGPCSGGPHLLSRRDERRQVRATTSPSQGYSVRYSS